MTGRHPGQEGTASPTEDSRPACHGPAEEKTPGRALSAAIVTESTDTEAACEAFVVLLFTPAGRYRRHLFLSLHSATAAVQRARAKGQPVRMLLCRLVPVTGGVDLGEEWSA